jgi:hypothetical protein
MELRTGANAQVSTSASTDDKQEGKMKFKQKYCTQYFALALKVETNLT